MLDVEQRAELRREHFVRVLGFGAPDWVSRNTVRAALRMSEPPVFRVPERPSKLEPFKDEIHRLLNDDWRLPEVRVRELIELLGFDGSKTIVDDYLREVPPMFLKRRAHQRTVYRRAWVVAACLGYSRVGVGALIFSEEAPDVLWGMTRCLWSLGALPELMVWDRE